MDEKHMLPRWEKVGYLITKALEDPQMMDKMRRASREENLQMLHEMGFDTQDLANLDNDLKQLSGSILGAVRFWL